MFTWRIIVHNPCGEDKILYDFADNILQLAKRYPNAKEIQILQVNE